MLWQTQPLRGQFMLARSIVGPFSLCETVDISPAQVLDSEQMTLLLRDIFGRSNRALYVK